MKYLDALAQYKLHTRVKDEVEAFIKGRVVRATNAWKIRAGGLYSKHALEVGCVFLYVRFSGLNELVPDNLLIMFSEQELEVRHERIYSFIFLL